MCLKGKEKRVSIDTGTEKCCYEKGRVNLNSKFMLFVRKGKAPRTAAWLGRKEGIWTKALSQADCLRL